MAHLGYFRDEFVVKRQWLDERAFADLVALCQFLPGPASSQVGFAVGLKRAGLLGGLSAWAGFTLPSALALTLFAYGEGALTGSAGLGLVHGFKLVAVVIVAAAVLGMARSLTPDLPRAMIALLALVMTTFASGGASQAAVIALGGLAGLLICQRPAAGALVADPSPISRLVGFACLAAYLALLALSFVPGRGSPLGFLAAVTRSGALVFGGGHVVLPLLKSAVVDPGWISDGAFLAGYGAAQAVPGPLFSFAAYLGALAAVPPGGALGAALALAAIYLPGILILMGALPFWHGLSRRPEARAATAGVNAAVVGLLASALYDPVWTGAVKRPTDFAIVAAGFAALVAGRAPPLAVVALTAAAGVGLALVEAGG